MDSLRLVLLGIGVVVVLAIYLYERTRRGRSEQRYSRFGGSEDRDFVPRQSYARPKPAFDDTIHDFDTELADEQNEPAPAPARPVQALRNITDELEQLESIIAGRDDDIERLALGDLDVAADRPGETPVVAEPDRVIMVNLFATDGRVFSGVDILDATIHHDLVYGDMQFFHRYDPHGNTVFTVASAINPGTFPLSEMETFSTRGLAFFMTLPCSGDPLANFDSMLSTARAMEADLHGQLHDDRRSALTRQGIDTIRDSIAAYKLKSAGEANHV